MKMRRNNRKNRRGAITSIDLTSLMDLTFMLLIVFVITVPVIEFATDVTPPELDGKTKAEEIENPVLITLNQAGVIDLDSQSVAMHELDSRLLRLRQERGQVNIMIRAHGERPYEDIVAIMRAAQKAGLNSVSLMTQAEKIQ
ncbi:MAG: biopolymer transporter ExbD [Lentisphaeria bacterium]|nr:biopolymer transporter ExbD [Lentisphaeria bacterium]NLZ60454.1 biopolymer transporter ExbD [Lentisphaerota bacterium]